MGLNFYCAACGKRYLLQFDQETGYPRWFASCLCQDGLVVPNAERRLQLSSTARRIADALDDTIGEIINRRR
jgi:phage/plasmid primase-like uncharacterized protein